MAFVKVWIHVVWATKNRYPTMKKAQKTELFKHIRENAKNKEIYLDFINGMEDHIHCLISLNSEMSISKMMQLIKGEAAFWANKNKIFTEKLEWADEYFAVSVSESQVDAVREYIRNQEKHHSKKTFAEEYQEFIEKFGFAKFYG